MYENETYEAILERMMQRALARNQNLDSREGSLLWLGEAPAAVELQNLYIALDSVLQNTFADTASRDYLILRAMERGLSPYPATAAILEMEITPQELALQMGARFSVGDLNYRVTGKRGAGKYEITCETPGEAGNSYTGACVPIEYIEGLTSCRITALLIPGEDDEDTEAFRQRYMDSLNAQAFGGNRADYIQKVNAIQGVGGVKVYRAWNQNIHPSELVPPEAAAGWISGLSGTPEGVKEWVQKVHEAASKNLLTVGGTVKLVIIDSEFKSPSEELIQKVQTEIDPLVNGGEGLGTAPIGHVVRVEGVQKETVNITFTLTYQESWNWAAVESYVKKSIEDYFLELAKTWAGQEEPLVVRISQIESRLLDIEGILDIKDTAINGAQENAALTLDHIPVLGTAAPTE